MAMLVHVCCAPCLLGPLERDLGGATGFFCNPNIHPLIEFRRRLKAVRMLAAQERWPIICDGDYGLELFLAEVAPSGGGGQPLAAASESSAPTGSRCRKCYRLRLQRTAEEARRGRFESFTTTLLVSRHQDHEAVRQVGLEVADEVGVKFAYYDWRPLADQGREQAQKRSLYRQQYCGCIFSEFERFRDTNLHLWQNGEKTSPEP